MLDIYEITDRIKYKPGYHLVVLKVTKTIYKLWWSFRRPDSRSPDVSEWGISGSVLIDMSEDPDEEAILRTIFGMTQRLEEHETREFLTYDGLRPFDPHIQLLPERTSIGQLANGIQTEERRGSSDNS